VLVIIHVAEGAAVVAAAIGDLHDEAVGLAGRTVYLSLISHGATLLHNADRPIMPQIPPFEKSIFGAEIA
jgi:hypothetical protein